jgi:hypothetical protein
MAAEELLGLAELCSQFRRGSVDLFRPIFFDVGAKNTLSAWELEDEADA